MRLETKIGAFGVGFYSVFADCEEPFVISGRKTMAFLWKGNSLYTKASALPADHPSQDTTFLLNYRSSTSPMPDLLSICQFLCTSLTFVGLESIDLFVDKWQIISLKKKSAPGASASLPKDIKPKTKEGLMKITGVVHQSTQIDAKWLNVVDWTPQRATQANEEEIEMVPSLKSLFSRLKGGTSSASAAAKKAAKEAEQMRQMQVADNVTATSQASVFLRISTVNIQTFASAAFAAELERATKKPPPKHTKIAILTSSHDETSASLSTQSGVTAHKATELFTSVLPNKHGRIFIGFPTAQTTGMLCHISAPSVIPTVERESIDLNARYVKTWNIEMLRVAGIACRIAYTGEMEELKSRISASAKTVGRPTIVAADIEAVTPHAVHVFKQYTAAESTPSANVGKLIEEAFWDCSTKASMDILSTKGVLPSHQVRVVSEPLSFVENVPLVPSSITSDAENFIRRLFERGMVSDMTVKDIQKELESRSLSEEQLMEFLKWSSAQLTSQQLDTTTIQSLLEAAVATIGGADGGQVMVLSQINTFLMGAKIPADMPLPDHTIPFKFTKGMTRQQLEQFGWDELQIVPWARFLVEGADRKMLQPDQSILVSPMFAKQFFVVLSKQWESLGQSSKASIVDLLTSRTVVPTKQGMRKPTDAYFPSVKLFDDLATVDLPAGVKEKVLTALGVRKTIELTVVFDRLMSQSPKGEQKWSFADLVRYLVSVKDDIPKQDIERLKNTAICPVEEGKGEHRKAGKLCKVSELFEPKDTFRTLGLPVLFWAGMWRPAGPEGRFLAQLGLRPCPDVPILVGKMLEAAATSNEPLYNEAFKYFVDFHHINGYAKFDIRRIADAPILRVEGTPFPKLYAPNNCYWDERASTMDFAVLAADLRPQYLKFGVAQNPPIQTCATRLINTPPKSVREAMMVFGYLSGRLGEINANLAEAIGNSKIVPIFKRTAEKSSVRYVNPKMVFLGDPQAYGDILDFVDFGIEANSFLLKVGSKNEPSSLELARMVIADPGRILGSLETTRYTDLLRKLAENQATLKADKVLWKEMKGSAFLLGYTEEIDESTKKSSKSGEWDDYDEDVATVRSHSLRRPEALVVVDMANEYSLFREHLCCAPDDTSLERFYSALGVPALSSLIKEDDTIGNMPRDQSYAQKFKNLIIERTRVFLYDYQGDLLRDVKWLEKSLSVVLVEHISRRISLQGYRVRAQVHKRTAAIQNEGRKGVTLFITPGPDYYEVSTQIAYTMLPKPRQNDIIALESVMSSDLRRLRVKGYNVDRILARKEYENRIAKEQREKQAADERRRAEEEQQRQAAERKLATEGHNGAPPPYEDAVTTPTRIKSGKAVAETPMPNMPGAFGTPEDDSPRDREIARQGKRPANNNIFSSFQDSMQGWGQQLLGSRPNVNQGLPAPGSHDDGLAYGESAPDPNRHVNPVDSEKNVARNLNNAIQACRSHTSSSIFSQPQQSQVEEAKGSYCDNKPAQNISFASTSAGGIKVFLSAAAMATKDAFLTSESASINTFSYILLDLGSIFNLPPSTLHIFHDSAGSTIAFNQNGALFFNYFYFKSLHAATWETSRSTKMDALAYWWITMCHELAHNLVGEHSARHSFYAESFAQGYFGKVMGKALQYS
jgi:hypothetical protein